MNTFHTKISNVEFFPKLRYIVAIIPFLSHFNIHSSINSIILCSTFILWTTTQYFEYVPLIYKYNRDHNSLQRLCQHLLKTSSPCLPLHMRTKIRYYNYYMQTHDKAVIDANPQWTWRNQLAWNECTTNLDLLNWHLEEKNVSGSISSRDRSEQ